MKRYFVLALIVAILASVTVAAAEDLGVQVIGGSSPEMMPITLDDIQLETMVEIPGYAELTPTSWDIQDCFFQRKKDVLETIYVYDFSGTDYNKGIDHTIECDKHRTDEYKFYSEDWLIHNESKTQAEFALLFMDILNTTSKTVDFGKNITVKVVFDDNIEYQGWYRQRNFDLNICTWLDPENNFPIDPYYIGHYVFGCTLPNSVVESDKPLRMEISIDGNDITYNVRK